MNSDTLILPKLHTTQLEAAKTLKRFTVLCCGRRWGKTKFCLSKIIRDGLRGQTLAWIAPSYKIMQEVFEEIIAMVYPVISSISKRDYRLSLKTGGLIEFWSGEADYPCESRKYHGVVIDEAASMPNLEKQWTHSIRPSLTDYCGKGMFISTPKGMNYFHTLAEKHKTDKNWAYVHYTTYDNEHIDPKEIDDAKAELPSIVFRQEYLAEFVTGAGALVQKEWIRTLAPPPIDNLYVTMGVDFGVSLSTLADYTACVVLGQDQRPDGTIMLYVLDADRIRGTQETIFQWIVSKYNQYQPSQVVLETVQAQMWMAQELVRRTSLPVVACNPVKHAVQFGGKDKVSRAQKILAKYEHGYIYHSPDITRKNEFEDEILSFPVGSHDDMMDALVYSYFPSLDEGARSCGVM